MEFTTPIDHALRTAKWVGRLAYLIALVGVAGSYGTQVDLLVSHDMGWFAWAIPATVDLLGVSAAMALHLPDLDRGTRKLAGWTLAIAVAVSMTANVTGGHDTVARLAHAWPVLAYLLGELLATRVRAYAAQVVATRAAAQQMQTATPEPKASDAQAEDLPEAPVSPAVSTDGVRGDYGPRNGSEYSTRHERRRRNGK